jgi:hypothetical protein
MLLEHDRSACTISILQEAFIDSTLVQFNLTDSTTISTPLTPRTQLSAAECPTLKDELAEVSMHPYRELVGALAWLALGTCGERGRRGFTE